jgi:predicted nucleotidyltransferase
MAIPDVKNTVLAKAASVTQESLAEFCRRWKVAELAVFGSILGEDFKPDSDVDVLVTFIPDADWGLFDHVKMQQELKTLLKRDVDLVSRRAVERSKNWIRRKSILSSAQVVYAI